MFALLDAVAAGSPIDMELLRQILGDEIESLSPEDMDGLRVQFARLLHLPREEVAMLVKGALAQGVEPFLRRMRDKAVVTEELFSAIADKRPFPLAARCAFGVLSAAHERAFRRAVECGSFTRQDASDCYYQGAEVMKRLRGHGVCEVRLSFPTADYQGMPVAAPSADGVQFVDIVEVEASHGSFRMLVSNESELWQLSHPEEDTLQWLQESISKDSVLLDVGANVGFYSLYAARVDPSVRVVSFEPSPFNFARLCMNVQLNDITSVVAYPFAIVDMTEITSFGIAYAIPGGWSHPGILPPSKFDTLRVGCAAFRLDDVIKMARLSLLPTHLKIDVDGLDVRVLRGAAQTLALPGLRHVLIELSDDRCAEVQSIMEPLGFELTNAHATGFCNRIYIKHPRP
jgi:FkbM family methyltransferase